MATQSPEVMAALARAGNPPPVQSQQTAQGQLQTHISNAHLSEEVKTGSVKTFHNQTAGSSFFKKDGTRYEFNHKGELTTDDLELQAELERIADKPGSPVYYKGTKAVPAPGDSDPAAEIRRKAEETIQALQDQARAAVRS